MRVSGLFAMLRNRARRQQLYSTAAYWDTKARDLSGDAASMWPNNTLNKYYAAEQQRLLDQTLTDLRDKRVLDLGCGTGRLSRALTARGAQVTGIDFSSEAITLARSRSTPDIEYRVQSVFDLCENSTYDLVLSWGCITIAALNREQLVVLMRRLRASLKPGGQALLLEPVHRGFIHRVLDMDVDVFCAVMHETGFAVEWVKQMHFYPVRLALAFVPWPDAVTRPMYNLGQALMGLPGLRTMGDYKAIYAIAR